MSGVVVEHSQSFQFKGKTYYRWPIMNGPFGSSTRISDKPFPAVCPCCGQDSTSQAAELDSWRRVAERLETEKQTAERLLAEARAALTPSAETKAAYMGEFFERVEVVNPMYEGNEDDEDDEPETIIQSVPVSWTTIKEIMAAISARTLTNGGENGR